MRCCFQRLISNHQFVVIFVRRTYATQNINGLFDRWFFHDDRLEAAFKRRVALDVLPVFVLGCRSDDLQLPTRERRLQNIGCVDR